MRNPERIEEMLPVLRTIWEKNPDLRLAQIIVNAARPEVPCPQIFYVEDDMLLQGLHQLSKEKHDGEPGF
jgi:uncharacterized protein YihD (DUF1040 family)